MMKKKIALKEKKKGGVEAPPLLKLGDGTHSPKSNKRKKRKKENKGAQTSPLLKPLVPKSNKT